MTEPQPFGTLADGSPVTKYTIAADGGAELRVLDLGATVQSLRGFELGAEGGRGPNVVLGFPDANEYLARPCGYHGAIVGRYANRIADGRFALDGVDHVVAPNEGPHCLHGGPGGFHSRLWEVTSLQDSSLTFELVSPDGDQGFPGRLTTSVTYTVTPDGVGIEISAHADASTVVNLTNHSYFNLAGEGAGSVDGHFLSVEADSYLPVDSDLIPLGELAGVPGTPFDLTRPTLIGRAVRDPHEQVTLAHGIDHCFVLREQGMRRAARLLHPESGRLLEVFTDQPALQVYTGNFLDGSRVGTSGRNYRQGDGVALETQGFPDAPNRPSFPTSVLRPGSTYNSYTSWRLDLLGSRH